MAEAHVVVQSIRFVDILEICSTKERLLAWLRLHKLLHNFHEQCSECGNGFVHIRQDKSVNDGRVWRCSNRGCSHKISTRRESFFEGAHLTI